MLKHSRGIVLHTLRYSDEAIIAHVQTETAGHRSFLIRISRTRKGHSLHTLFQPLALLELTWEESANPSLCRPKSVVVSTPLTSLPFDPYKTTMALFLAEFLDHALRGEPASEALFEYIYYSVVWLDTASKDFANFHLVFLLRLTRFLGLFPKVTTTYNLPYFDLVSCTFHASKPAHPHFLPPEDTARLPVLLRMRYENMHLFHLQGNERNRFLQLINDYYRIHRPDFPELKSLSILREVFS